MLFFVLLSGLLIGSASFFGAENEPVLGLFRDLEIVEEVDYKINDSLPVLLNYSMQGGYFNMPSARMAEPGNVAIGYSYLPPYRLVGLNFQYFEHMELTGNYWIFHGVTEMHLGSQGYGDDADRIANIKVSLLREKDGIPFVPEIALGMNDFMGSMRFHSFYTVATKNFLAQDLEFTMGWGCGRIRGFFGGLAWSPFRHQKNIFKGITLAVEYDANNYKAHSYEHVHGRDQKSPINAGIHFSLFDFLKVSASTVRGKEIGASVALNYNFGTSKGFFPKFADPLPYSSPVDREPIGPARTETELAQEVAFAFRKQGFDLYSMIVFPGPEPKLKNLWMKVVNVSYRDEDVVRSRIQRILGALVPSNIFSVRVVIESDGVDLQEYLYYTRDLRKFYEEKIGSFELSIISPMREVTPKPGGDASVIFRRNRKIWTLTFLPVFRTYFGSAKGKFKYDAGLQAGPEGYLPGSVYYSLWGSYIAISSTHDIAPRDFYHPSHIVQVRSDSILYRQSSSFHLESAFLQKSWNMGYGWFSRLALGYFEIAYAGAALEALYYPVYSDWAVGLEIATVLKRKYRGIGFQKKIRKFDGSTLSYVDFVGLQYFIDLYYDFKPLEVDFKVSVGQFLAKDKGVRFEATRYFKSGFRLSIWYSITNGKDVIHNRNYYDKGFAFSLPLDIFLNKSSRTRIGYAMSAWLRDVGAKANTGKELFPILHNERESI